MRKQGVILLQIICLLILFGFSSCFSDMRISKAKEGVTERTINKLKPGRSYLFHLNNGGIIKIKIQKIENDVVYGDIKQLVKKGAKVSVPYSESFSEIQKNVKEIRKFKFNPYATGAIILPFAIITYLLYSGEIDIYNP